MLSRPEDGWTYFQPGKENRYRLSYLTDVAVDWLTQAIHGLETMDVFSVHGFSEPGRMVCTVSYWSCYVIFEDDGPAPVCEDITHLHINMIEESFDAWVHWDDDSLEEGGEEAVRARAEKLRALLGELKRLVGENEDCFLDGCFF